MQFGFFPSRCRSITYSIIMSLKIKGYEILRYAAKYVYSWIYMTKRVRYPGWSGWGVTTSYIVWMDRGVSICTPFQCHSCTPKKVNHEHIHTYHSLFNSINSLILTDILFLFQCKKTCKMYRIERSLVQYAIIVVKIIIVNCSEDIVVKASISFLKLIPKKTLK